MDRVAVFVDAGYVFAQGSVLLDGRKRPRSEVTLDHETAIQVIADFATATAQVPLLRVYWYDGTSTGPTPQHLTLAHLQNVKVRLGFVNSVGEQKGVDSLIVTDMITLARNGSISDAVLLSGDEDLRVGVQQAQEFGVRVHLVGIKPSRGSQSLFLLQEADTTHEWGAAEVSRFLSCKPRIIASPDVTSVPREEATRPPVVTVETEIGSLDLIAARAAGALAPAERRAVIEAFESEKQLPREIDRKLLTGGRTALRRDLLPAEKKQIRKAFVDACTRAGAD
jgi:hypothetical protein